MGHITTGTSTFEGGFEYYTFQIGIQGLHALTGVHDALQTLAGWYLSSPRPSASEIVGIVETKPNPLEGLVIVTIKIQRGHYFLTEFYRKHTGHRIHKWDHDDGQIEMYCDNCEEGAMIYNASIPVTKFLSREQMQRVTE